MFTEPLAEPVDSVDLYWLPLGAGGRSVHWNGLIFEAISARMGNRDACDLYHSALEISLGADRFVVEMTPAWGVLGLDRGVVSEGPVGTRWAGCSRFFRYEIHSWRNGSIADAAEAVASPQRLTQDTRQAARVLSLVPSVPTPVWGRDELDAGEMWNSNSVIAWLLAQSGFDVESIHPPQSGRAPGWNAGLAVARRYVLEPC